MVLSNIPRITPTLAGFFHQIEVLSGAIQINPAISFYLVRSRGDLAYSSDFSFLLRAARASRRRFPPALYMGRSRSRSRSRDRDRGRDRSLSSSSSSSEDSAEREERMQRERDERDERELKRGNSGAGKFRPR